MTLKKLKENSCHEWKLTTVDPHERNTWKSGVSSTIHHQANITSQLPGRGPTDVADAPAPACKQGENPR